MLALFHLITLALVVLTGGHYQTAAPTHHHGAIMHPNDNGGFMPG